MLLESLLFGGFSEKNSFNFSPNFSDSYKHQNVVVEGSIPTLPRA